MFSAKIYGNTNYEAKFQTIEECNTWFEEMILTGGPGKPERWLKEIDFTTETVEQAIETREITELDQTVTEYKFASEYTTEIVDISNDPEYLKQQFLALKTRKASFGQTVINELLWDNSQALAASQMTAEQAIQMNTLFAPIESLLKRGDLEFALAMIQALEVGPLVTEQMKTKYSTLLQNYLAQ